MLQKSALPNKYVHIKPQDWEDFEALYPVAAKMLAERSLYRHYLQARLDSWGLDDPIARSHAETLAKELEPFVINPHSHLPIQQSGLPLQTATPPLFPNDPDMEFLAGCTAKERDMILRAAHGGDNTGLPNSLFLSLERLLFIANSKQPPTATATPHITYPEIEFFESLPHDERLILLETALQGMRDEEQDGFLDISDEVLASVAGKLNSFMSDTNDLSDRYLRSRGEEYNVLDGGTHAPGYDPLRITPLERSPYPYKPQMPRYAVQTVFNYNIHYMMVEAANLEDARIAGEEYVRKYILFDDQNVAELSTDVFPRDSDLERDEGHVTYIGQRNMRV